MLHLCDIVWVRKDIKDKNWKDKRLGKLFYDPEKDRAALLLEGFRAGTAIGRPVYYKGKAPYLAGDICAATGTYTSKKDGQAKTAFLWVGHIQSGDDKDGVIYTVTLDVMPLVKMDNKDGGIWLSVFQDNHEPAKSKNTDNDDSGLPF